MLLRKDIKVVTIYNASSVFFLVIIELNVHDTTGMGMLFIPEALILLTIIYWGVILFLYFKKREVDLRLA
jgi:hypothetical protein